MGKVIKAKSKAKSKISRVVEKCGRAAAKSASVLALIMIASGCSSTGEQPARSQTMNNDFRDCIVVVASHASISNRTVTADGRKEAPSIELFTQTQANEGSETVSPTATPTNKTDLRPDVDVNTTGGRTAGVLETAIAAGMNALGGTKQSCASGNCNDGSCSDGSCSTCSDGSCSE